MKFTKSKSREEALRLIRQLSRPLPPGFRFDRLEANERRTGTLARPLPEGPAGREPQTQ